MRNFTLVGFNVDYELNDLDIPELTQSDVTTMNIIGIESLADYYVDFNIRFDSVVVFETNSEGVEVNVTKEVESYILSDDYQSFLSEVDEMFRDRSMDDNCI